MDEEGELMRSYNTNNHSKIWPIGLIIKSQLIYFFVNNLIVTMREGDFISNVFIEEKKDANWAIRFLMTTIDLKLHADNNLIVLGPVEPNKSCFSR